jgi:hypothetical protein
MQINILQKHPCAKAAAVCRSKEATVSFHVTHCIQCVLLQRMYCCDSLLQLLLQCAYCCSTYTAAVFVLQCMYCYNA